MGGGGGRQFLMKGTGEGHLDGVASVQTCKTWGKHWESSGVLEYS